jgi:hypothetical protein
MTTLFPFFEKKAPLKRKRQKPDHSKNFACYRMISIHKSERLNGSKKNSN